ncbi:MAG: 5-deoxy-glucuronate isomerase [Candidatus Obscuribacterales bacterium]|nr:5-deoxy-glucuronate isomerase [Cyanobacteria bacterium SZAS LIN-5]RTL40653.1 MAG: 5-deoxy-glucuronate isomerase [Candidatus Melainabacteria bacterium]
MTSHLLVCSQLPDDENGVITRVTAESAGWEFLNMEARRLGKGQTWKHQTDSNELVLVILGGRINVRSNRGDWLNIGRRANVFDGMPNALYLPRETEFEVQSLTEHTEIAAAWTATDQEHPARLITADQSKIEIRGGGNATRQINSIIEPGFDCHRLVCVEVYTPGGNWSSYPPHKHDVHKEEQGKLLEADLEEIYFYKFNRPEAFAYQRVYTDDRSLDESIAASNNDIVLIPEGYHPVSAAYGYDCYYLNFLAGSAQSLAATDDPAHAWTRETWHARDPRLPLVTHAMEEMVLS